MSFRFVPCATCGRHGRFVDGPGRVPVEVASKETALAILNAAVFYRAISAMDAGAFTAIVVESAMPEEEGIVDPLLREHVTIWNQAAYATNAPARFADTDFHAYVRLLEPQAASHGNPQPN